MRRGAIPGLADGARAPGGGAHSAQAADRDVHALWLHHQSLFPGEIARRTERGRSRDHDAEAPGSVRRQAALATRHPRDERMDVEIVEGTGQRHARPDVWHALHLPAGESQQQRPVQPGDLQRETAGAVAGSRDGATDQSGWHAALSAGRKHERDRTVGDLVLRRKDALPGLEHPRCLCSPHWAVAGWPAISGFASGAEGQEHRRSRAGRSGYACSQ